MSPCVVCGLNGTGEICDHHYTFSRDTWAIENKIWCDYIHRKVEPRRIKDDEIFDHITSGWDIPIND